MGTRRARAGQLPTLIFLRERTSGPSRRMESLVAWVKVTRKTTIRVVDVDVEKYPETLRRFGIGAAPALVLIDRGEVIGKLEGRARGRDIDVLVDRAGTGDHARTEV